MQRSISQKDSEVVPLLRMNETRSGFDALYDCP